MTITAPPAQLMTRRPFKSVLGAILVSGCATMPAAPEAPLRLQRVLAVSDNEAVATYAVGRHVGEHEALDAALVALATMARQRCATSFRVLAMDLERAVDNGRWIGTRSESQMAAAFVSTFLAGFSRSKSPVQEEIDRDILLQTKSPPLRSMRFRVAFSRELETAGTGVYSVHAILGPAEPTREAAPPPDVPSESLPEAPLPGQSRAEWLRARARAREAAHRREFHDKCHDDGGLIMETPRAAESP